MKATQELKMPKMGESITEGTVINWLVKVGDTFREGDILLEVATDKVDNEIPAPCSGRLLQTTCQAKDVIPVGHVIAVLEILKLEDVNLKSEPAVNDTSIAQETKIAKNPHKAEEQPQNHPESFKVNKDMFISPLVDAIAKQHHISYEELARVPASGAEGRLRKSDLMRYIADGRPFKFVQPDVSHNASAIPDLKFDKGTGKVIKMDRMRQMIADHMVYSKHTSPHVTAYAEADVTDLVAWRNAVKNDFFDKHAEKLTFTPLFIEAVSKAVLQYPNINASVDGDSIIVKPDINIGMATALPSGNLIVPVVKQAEKKSLVELAKTVNKLVVKARENKLAADDIKGSTFTISNVGTFGSLMGTPIINQPEVAILAFGIIKKRAEVIETKNGDEIAIRSMMILSLSFDHRVVDGHLGGSFLKQVANNLENFDSNRIL